MSERRSLRWTTLSSYVLVAILAVILTACGAGRPQPGEGEISVSVTVFGNGTVTAGDFTCEGTATCFWVGDGSTPVTFEAEPDQGNVLVRWGGACSTFEDSCTRLFENGDEYNVRFAPHALRLFLEGDGTGYFKISGGGIEQTGQETRCWNDCAIQLEKPLELAITYQGDATRNDLSVPWGGACSGSTLDNYCLVDVSGQTNVSKTWTHPPIAVGESYGTPLDTTLSVDAASGVLANDDDTPDDVLRAELVSETEPENGDLTLRPDGGFDFVPKAGWSGVYGFRYAVLDAFDSRDVADVTITVSDASLTLTKTGVFDDGGDGTTDVGDTINYTFTITNDGNTTLTNITLDDPLATVTGGPIATLAVGTSDTTTYTATYAITQDDIDTGNVTNTATANSDQTGPIDDEAVTAVP